MLYFVHFELVFCCFSVFVVDFFVVHQTLQVLSQLIVLYDVCCCWFCLCYDVVISSVIVVCVVDLPI